MKPRAERDAGRHFHDAMLDAMAAIGTGGDVHAGFRDPVILDFDRLKAEAAKSRSA